jgi:hypothetical protein
MVSLMVPDSEGNGFIKKSCVSNSGEQSFVGLRTDTQHRPTSSSHELSESINGAHKSHVMMTGTKTTPGRNGPLVELYTLLCAGFCR